MDEKAKKTLDKLAEVLPKLSEISQEKVISYSQGLEEGEASAEIKKNNIKDLC